MSTQEYVRYFIPVDGDTEDHPNIFAIKKSASDVTVGDIRMNFPLPGSYVFRFKYQYQKTFVWMDVSDDAQPAPRYKSAIVCKVSRTSFKDSRTRAPVSRTPVSGAATSAPAYAPPSTARNPTHSPRSSSSKPQAASSKTMSSASSARPTSRPAPSRASSLGASAPVPAAAAAPAAPLGDDDDILGLGLGAASSPAPESTGSPAPTGDVFGAPPAVDGGGIGYSGLEGLDIGAPPPPATAGLGRSSTSWAAPSTTGHRGSMPAMNRSSTLSGRHTNILSGDMSDMFN